jgi:hypothetical protein
VTAFVAFWELRSHAVAEEVVRGGRRRRTDAPWVLPAAVAVQLRGLLEARGFDATRPITVREAADRDGFELSQEAGERPP